MPREAIDYDACGWATDWGGFDGTAGLHTLGPIAIRGGQPRGQLHRSVRKNKVSILDYAAVEGSLK